MLDIQRVMKSKGITRQILADKLGINPVSVSRLINGNPTIETLQKIANALNVEVVELFEDKRNGTAVICPNCGTSIDIEIKTKE